MTARSQIPPPRPTWLGGGTDTRSDFSLLRDGKGIVYLDAQIADRTFDLGVAEQKLDRSEIASPFVDEGCLGSPQ